MGQRDVNININGKDNFSGAAGSASRSASSLKATLDKLNGPIGGGGGGLTNLLGGVGLGAAASSAVSFGVKSSAAFEQTTVAFKTMLKSGTAAKDLLADISKFAAETPFEFTELADASKKLLAFGVAADDIVPTLRRIGDISSGIGAPIGEIAELYGKARVQGRLFAEDVNQFTGRGIPIIQELAKQFGVSDSQVRKLVEDGKVGFKNLEQAFSSMSGEGGQFFNMMAEQSQTLAGKFSTLKDSIEALARAWGDKLNPVVKFHLDMMQFAVSGQLPADSLRMAKPLIPPNASMRNALNMGNAIDAGKEALKTEQDPARRAKIQADIDRMQKERDFNQSRIPIDAQLTNIFRMRLGKGVSGLLGDGGSSTIGDMFTGVKQGFRAGGEGLDLFKQAFKIIEDEQGPQAAFKRRMAELEQLKPLIGERRFDTERQLAKNKLNEALRGGMGNDRGEAPEWGDIGRHGAVVSRMLTRAPGHSDPNEEVAKNTKQIAADAKERAKKEEADRQKQYLLLQRLLRRGLVLKASNLR